MARPSKIHAILFDAVGTLMFPAPPVEQAYQSLGRQFGSSLAASEIKQRFADAFASQEQADAIPGDALCRRPTNSARERQRWQRIVAAVFHDVAHADGPLFEALWDHFAQPQHWQLFSDAVAICHRLLQQSDVTLGIASNFDQRIIAICRELTPFIDSPRIFFSAEIGFSKPDADFFRAIQQRLDLPPQDLLMVGDHPVNDFQGARAAGWNAVLVNRDSHSPSDDEIHSLNQLVAQFPL